MKGLTISQVASAANVSIESVRYYEKRGLLPHAPRSEAGYRMFTNEAIEDIQFIKRAQEIGFTLEEIRKVLSLYKQDDFTTVMDLYPFAQSKIKEIEQQISQLQQFKALLESVTTLPPSMLPLSKADCPVLQKCAQKEV